MVTVDGINEKTSVAEAIRKAQDFAPELKAVIPPRGFAFNAAGVPAPTDTAKVTVESADALNAVAWTPRRKIDPHQYGYPDVAGYDHVKVFNAAVILPITERFPLDGFTRTYDPSLQGDRS